MRDGEKVEWVMGDTPQTAMITRAPAVLKKGQKYAALKVRIQYPVHSAWEIMKCEVQIQKWSDQPGRFLLKGARILKDK